MKRIARLVTFTTTHGPGSDAVQIAASAGKSPAPSLMQLTLRILRPSEYGQSS